MSNTPSSAPAWNNPNPSNSGWVAGEQSAFSPTDPFGSVGEQTVDLERNAGFAPSDAPDNSDQTSYVVDAHTNTVYHGVIHDSLQEAYDDTGKRNTISPRNTHVNGVQPVLARFAVRKDDVTNQDVTTWYPVSLDNVAPGPLPGEWKLVHLTSEV